MKDVLYKGYTIKIDVAVCTEEKEIIDEFDTVNEAKAFIKEQGWGEIWYLAAEVINKEGDTNPACWGKTREEALNKLKKVL
jgi:hypothetical protein